MSLKLSTLPSQMPPISTLILDDQFLIKSCHSHFAKLLGLRPEDLKKPFQKIKHRLHRKLFPHLTEALETSQRVSFDLELDDGRTLLCQIMPPLQEAFDPPSAGLLISLIDWTHLNSASSEVGQEVDRLFSTESEQSAILVDAGHNEHPILSCNAAFEKMTGYHLREILGQNCRFLQDDDREQAARAELRAALWERRTVTSVLRNYRKDGTPFWNRLTLYPVHNERGHAVQFLGLQEDVTTELRSQRPLSARQRSPEQRARRRAQSTLRSLADAVFRTDLGCQIDYLNPMAENLIGGSAEALHQRRIDELLLFFDEHSGTYVESPVQLCLDQKRTVLLPERCLLDIGQDQRVAIQGSVSPLIDQRGRLSGSVMVLRDATESHKRNRRLARLSTHDALTGLFNRAEFERRLAETLQSAQKHGSEHALCFLDIDQFRLVNDLAGHVAGDELLRRIAELLKEESWPRDLLARLGDDEFGLLLIHCPPKKAIEVAHALLKKMRQFQFAWEGRSFDLSFSIGLVPVDQKAESTIQLLSRGDVACFTAKELGGNQVHVYAAEDSQPARLHEQLRRVAELAEALRQERFRLFAQPILPLRDLHRPTPWSCEILLRYVDENDRLYFPDHFIPAAERYGLMEEIDRWVLCKVLSLHPSLFAQVHHLAINLSGNSLSDPTLLGFIKEQLQQAAIDPARLCFEITETAAVRHLEQAADLIRELRSLGCSFALDDFGTGMSSFSYLKHLPVDYLKIDRNFVSEMAESRVDRGVVAAINEIAHVMGIKTIAEGVEDEAAITVLRDMQVDYAQGFLLGHPRPIEEVLLPIFEPRTGTYEPTTLVKA